MANAAKDGLKSLGAGAEGTVPQAGELAARRNEGNAEGKGGASRFRLVAVLVAGLAIGAPGCTLDTSGLGRDSGAEQDENPDADVEMDAEAGEEDAGTDVGDSPDVPEAGADADVSEDEASEVPDVGPDSDVEAGEDAPDADGVMDEASDSEEAGDAGCVTTSEYEITGAFLDENVGESRQREEFWYRTDSYSGPECEAEAGERVFERIMFRLETPIADTSAEGLRNVVRAGGITKGFGSTLNKKILEIAPGHLTLATIIEGGVMGPGLVAQLFDGDRYLVWLNETGANPDGTKYAEFSFFDAETMMPAGGARVNEGGHYALPNGNRVMATGVIVGAAYSARVDIIGPADDTISNGAIRMREEDGMPYRFGMELGDGWSLYPTTL